MIIDSEIKKKLTREGVVTLYLFGSRVYDLEHSESDFDFGVLVKNPSVVNTISKKQALYLKLFDILSDAIHSMQANPVIDIVFLQEDVSLELKAHVISKGVVLFDSDPNLRAYFEEYIMIRMADFRSILNEMDKAILNRI